MIINTFFYTWDNLPKYIKREIIKHLSSCLSWEAFIQGKIVVPEYNIEAHEALNRVGNKLVVMGNICRECAGSMLDHRMRGREPFYTNAVINAKKGYVVDENGYPHIKATLTYCYDRLAYRIDGRIPNPDFLNILTDGKCNGTPSFFNEDWMEVARNMFHHRSLWLYNVKNNEDIEVATRFFWKSRTATLRNLIGRYFNNIFISNLYVANLIDQAPDSPIRAEIINPFMEAIVTGMTQNGFTDFDPSDQPRVTELMSLSLKWEHPVLVKKIKPMLVKFILRND